MPGIDQQIEQRKMQFGANPQALQQRYGQSKQLLDLLALQQIAAEQQQKSQAMALQMQQNPATVADQLEQEVIQGKKAEMAQSLQGMQAMRAPKRSQSDTARGVAGVLAQKQREQQSRMQKMAGSGIAGQPARNMERMYNGGIVGFNGTAGSGVMGTGNRYQKDPIEQTVQSMLDYFPNRRREAYKEILRKLRSGESVTSGEMKALREYQQEFPDVKAESDAIRKSETRAREEGYDVKELDVAGITLPRQEAPDLTQGVIEETLVEEPKKVVSTTTPQEDTVLARQEELLQGLMPGQAPTAEPKEASTELGLMQRMAQQKGQQMQELSQAGEDILGTPQLGGLEALARQPQVPEMLRRPAGMPAPAAPAAKPEPTTEEKILQQYLQGLTQQSKALAAEEEALKARYSGRSKGQKILDRLITAAQMQSQGAPARTNRQALSRLLGGYTVASGQERKAEEEGLAKLAERRSGLLSTQMSGLGSLAQIKRGEEQTDIAREQLSQQERQFMRTFGLDERRLGELSRQFDITAATQGKQLAATILRNIGQTKYEQAQVRLSEDRNRITEELGRATETGRRNSLVSELRKNSTTQTDNLREAMTLALEALPTSQEYVNADAAGKKKLVSDIREAYELEIQAYQDETTQLIKDLTGIDVPVSPLRSAPKSGGTSGFSIKSVR